MAATWRQPSKTIPINERAVVITDVVEGDRIDFTEILGRPAKLLVFETSDAADSVELRLNTLSKRQKDITGPQRSGAVILWGVNDVVETWLPGTTFVWTGERISTPESVRISSVEIVNLTLGTGSTIRIEAY